MRKRTSLRRWKARCCLRKPIAKEVILNYGLMRWFDFEPVSDWAEYYYAEEGK
jgi:hypothetical protein